MKEYQPQKNNPYQLPREVYMETLYLIRGYERLKEEYANVLNKTNAPRNGQPRGSGTANPTERDGIILATMFEKMKAIEQAMLLIPEEYRKGVISNVMHRKCYPEYAHRNTWSKYRCRFIYTVAKNMNWI